MHIINRYTRLSHARRDSIPTRRGNLKKTSFPEYNFNTDVVNSGEKLLNNYCCREREPNKNN